MANLNIYFLSKSSSVFIFFKVDYMLQLAVLVLFSALGHSTLTYQGFDFLWKREFASFETPHRVGPIANYIIPQSPTQYLLNVSFTPGVNGDWAFPGAHYSTYTGLGDSAEDLVFSVNVSWTDRVNTSTETAWFSTTAPLPQSTGKIAVLSGWRLDMQCDNITGDCSEAGMSEGIWPISFEIGLKGTNYTVTLLRGWTPTHGGGKPLTGAMAYRAVIYYQLISQGAAFEKPLSVHRNGDLHSQPEAVPVCLNTALPTTFGIRRFKFELLETDGHKNLGRYFEGLFFYLKPANGCYNATMGLTAPLTVYNSNYAAEMELQPITLAKNSSLESHYVNGTICVSGTPPYGFFSCPDHHMRNSFTDSVIFSN